MTKYRVDVFNGGRNGCKSDAKFLTFSANTNTTEKTNEKK